MRSFNHFNQTTLLFQARLEKIQAEECNGDKRQLLNEIVGDLGVSVKGRVRLYGRGVKKSDLRDKGAFKTIIYCPGRLY